MLSWTRYHQPQHYILLAIEWNGRKVLMEEKDKRGTIFHLVSRSSSAGTLFYVFIYISSLKDSMCATVYVVWSALPSYYIHVHNIVCMCHVDCGDIVWGGPCITIWSSPNYCYRIFYFLRLPKAQPPSPWSSSSSYHTTVMCYNPLWIWLILLLLLVVARLLQKHITDQRVLFGYCPTPCQTSLPSHPSIVAFVRRFCFCPNQPPQSLVGCLKWLNSQKRGLLWLTHCVYCWATDNI